MARHKPSGKKKHLSHALKQAQAVPSWVVAKTEGHALKQAQAVPSWVVAKTEGKVRRNPKQRHWRETKIKV